MATLTRAWTARFRSRRWTPVLHGRDEARARTAIHDILADLAVRSATGAASATETAEHALLLAEAAQLEGMRVDPTRVRELLELAADRRGTTGRQLLGGATGVAFALACARMLGEPRVPCTEHVDRALLGSVSQRMSGDCDFGYTGLVGFAIYTLARLPRRTARQCLEHLVARFEDRAETAPYGLTWRTPSGRFDLGVPHGVAGVVGVLAHMHAEGILTARTRPLVERGAAWLAHQPIGDAPHPAWCAGDPGVAVALWSAARTLGDRELEAEAARIAHRAAQQASAASLTDAGLRHGSAGLAQLFSRLHHASGDEPFRDVAEACYRRTLELRVTGDRSLLTGSIGIGLALVSACGNRAPVWDRLLLLDLPRDRG